MRNILTISFLVCFQMSFAQVILDATNNQYQGTCLLTEAGFKFQRFHSVDSSLINQDTLYLYNVDHSIYKSIPVPRVPVSALFSQYPLSAVKISFISDRLFDDDAEIEYLAYYKGVYGQGFGPYSDTLLLFLCDEQNGIVQLINANGNDNMGDAVVYQDNYETRLYSDGMTFAKLELKPGYEEYKYYTLPGLPACSSCMDSPSSISSESNNSDDVLIYPNPTLNEVQIDFQGIKRDEQIYIEWNNIDGKLLSTYTVPANQTHFSFSTSNYSNGTYFCSFFNMKHELLLSKKIIVMH